MVSNLTSRADKGFTLIELLVAIGIIGILVSMAIPQYAAYRRRGFESQVRYDLKNVATSQEAYYVDNRVYKSCGPCNDTNLAGFKPTVDVTINATPAGETYTLAGTHARCGADTWTYSSVTGAVTSPPTPCE